MYRDAGCSTPLDPEETASDTTLYAKWVEGYKIRFDANGGFTYGEISRLVVPGQAVHYNPYIRRSDDRFILAGWSTQPSGGDLILDLDNSGT